MSSLIGITFIVTCFLLSDTYCFRVQVHVQEIILNPDPAWFNCSALYLDPKDKIATIHWFKDDEEFYIYNAVDDSHSQKTGMWGQGITDVDERSEEGNIYLPRSNVNTTGCYKCMVRLTDGRHKEVEKRSETVYLPIGRGLPLIEVSPKPPEDFNTYFEHIIVIASQGETIGVNCTSRPSHPPAELFVKIDGIRRTAPMIHEYSWQEKLFEPIDGTTYQNVLFRSHLRVRFNVTHQMVLQKYIRVACSARISASSGFLDQQDSDSIRVRVVQEHKPVVKRDVSRDGREFMIFYGFFGVTGALLLLNRIFQNKYERKQAKKLRLRNLGDENSFNVSASYASKDKPVHYNAGSSGDDNNNQVSIKL